MKRTYTKRNFSGDSLGVILDAERICADYAQRGISLTLRQLYYRFVATALLPNSDKNYKRLGSIVNDARLAGLIDWSHLEDRTRNIRGGETTTTAQQRIDSLRYGVWRDHWATQLTRVEVWVEKDALIGIVETAAQAMGVQCFSCRGYTSQSEVWGAAQRLGGYIQRGQNVVIIHLGDHDPSGVDMSRDIEDRLTTFINTDWIYSSRSTMTGGSYLEIEEDMRTHLGGRTAFSLERIALTMDQVEEYNPPPNPAKITDSRAAKYIERWGDESWELDALDPDVLNDLITDKVREFIDQDIWDQVDAEIEEESQLLVNVADNWAQIQEFMATLGGENLA